MATAERIQTHDEIEMREWANQFMAENNMTQAALARQLGYPNPSALNQFLKGSYPSPATFVRKLSELRTISSASKPLHSFGGYVPLSISEDIYQTIRAIHLKGGLAVECGDPGIGKTMAGRKYASDYANNSVLVTVNPSFATKKNFFKMLCRACRLPEGPLDEMWYTCVNYFRSGGALKVLIIDEAQHLPAKVIDHIRSMADEVSTLGIVFLGNRRLSETMGGRQQLDYAQLISRTKIRRMRTTAQITLEDAQMLFPEIKEGHALKFILSVAQSQQGLRGASNLYSNALDREDTTFEGLVAMAKHMQMLV